MSLKNILFRSLVLVLALCTSTAVIAQAPPKNQDKIRALFLYGGHGFDEKAMYAMLDSFADVTYDKAEMPKALDLLKPGLEKQYDCLVMYDSYKFPFTAEQTEQFKAFLNRGIGLVVLHHSVWGFNGWNDFANITGCQYFFGDGNEINGVQCVKSTWADNQTIAVKITDKEHPITAGTDDFTMVDEVYAKGYLHPDVHVLWTTDHPKSDKAIAWTWKYANSPVFTTLQGHDAQAYNNPNFRRTVHQAIQWTASQLRQEKSLQALSTLGQQKLSAGSAKVSINPETFPVIVNGSFLSRTADQVVAPVFARALVLDNGSCRIALATIDVCILDTGLCNSIREKVALETKIPADHIMIMATHTHSGGSTAGALGTPMDQTYSALVQERTVEALVQAASRLVPVKVGWGAVSYSEGTNCRVWITRPDTMLTDPFGDVTVRAMMHPGYQNPAYIGPCGPVNNQLSVIALQTPDGKPFAVFANYPMHYFGSGVISPDYFGEFCLQLEKQLGIDSSEVSSGIVLLSQGTSGDQHWMNYDLPKVDKSMQEYAVQLVEVTKEVMEQMVYHDWAPLGAQQVIQTFERRCPDVHRLAWAREKIRAMEDRVLPKDRSEVYAYEAVFLDQDPKRDIPLQALRVGDVGMTAIPCEVYGITGLKLIQRSPFGLQITVELANGGEGYIPPPEIYPFGGYNTWAARSAALIPSAETEIVDISLSLLEKLKEKKRKTIPSVETDYSKAVLADKPFAYWRMNNIDGNVCPDSVLGEERAGTYFPCVAYWLEGPNFSTSGGEKTSIPAVHFAGGYATGNLVGLPQNYSFETWIWNGLDPENRPVTGYFFSRGKSGVKTSGDHLGIGGTHNNSGAKKRLFLYNGDEHKQLLIGKTEIPFKEWTHIVLTRHGNQVALYVNGKLDVQGELPCSSIDNEPIVFVGNRSDLFSGLEGKMAETAFYNRVLTAKEVEKHWNAANVLPKP